MTIKFDSYPLVGGMDTVTPYLSRTAGSVIFSLNWEPDMDGGYSILPGYERFDGRTAPSDAVLYAVELDDVTGIALAQGDVFTATGSGATGYFAALDGNHVVYVPKSGDIISGDVIETHNAITDGLPAEYLVEPSSGLLNTMREILRSNIDTVPGSGPIRGVWTFEGTTYVFRDNVGATACDIHKSSDTGWTLVDLTGQFVLTFKDATKGTPFAVGETIATGGNTAVVRSVANTSNDRKAGYLVVDTVVGTINDTDVITGPVVSTLSKSTSGSFAKVLLEYRNSATNFVIGDSVTGGSSAAVGVIWFLEYTTATEGVLYFNSPITGAFTDGEALTETISGDTYSYANGASVPGHFLYTDGLYSFSVGEKVTGVTSGATGTVYRVVTDTAIFMTGVTGTFVTGEDLNVTPAATVDGALEQVSISPGGAYVFDTYNFFADQTRNAMYGADGVNTAFQFDGTTYTPIRTGVDDQLDTPYLCFEHSGHLFVGYQQGSLQHSVVGEPLNWNGALGAFEFGFGSELTDVIPSPSSLVVTTEDNLQVIYGSGVADWTKDIITNESSGFQNTGRFLGRPYVFSEGGLMALDLVQAFGNFKDSIISDAMQNIFDKLKGKTTFAIADHDRAQYVLFTNTGTNYTFTFKQNTLLGIMPFKLDHIVNRAYRVEDDTFLLSDTSEYVYKWRKGTSHDGQSREVLLKLSYSHAGSPKQRKRYRRLTMSLKAFESVELQATFDFSKGMATVAPSARDIDSIGGGGQWNIGDWNVINWDGQSIPEFKTDIDGVGTDVSVTLYQEGANIPSISVEDVIFEYSFRGRQR